MKNYDYKELVNMSIEELLDLYKTKKEGLSEKVAKRRLEEYGENIATNNKKKTPLYFIFESFKDKFILILLLLAVIDYFTNDLIGALIIVGITIISVIIRFVQDYSTYRFNLKLKEQLKIYTDVIRNGKQKEIRQEDVVVGDIITLSAGSVVPADLILIESKDLFVNQASFTGESIAVEKKVKKTEDEVDPIYMSNVCLMGMNIISGNGLGLVVKTGKNTYIGKMNQKVVTIKNNTSFDEGMTRITNLLIRYMIVISLFVFIVYGVIRKDLTEALLFSLSVAVGITPSMLPMIVNVNLTKGSKSLSKKQTLVKNISSIQNLGSMDVLCTDKTGTLTENDIVLQKYMNLSGEEDNLVLKYAYLNSKLGTGFKNLIDKAVIKYGQSNKIDINEYRKVDEIPFDYTRKRMSVVVTDEKGYSIITKGALDEIVKVCDTAYINGKKVTLSKKIIDSAHELEESLSKEGMQVIALAVKHEYKGIDNFTVKDETDLTLIGLIAFLDPPKKSAKNTIDKLADVGVTTKILTGDNIYATKAICEHIGLDPKIILGLEIDELDDHELSLIVEDINIFARMNPIQKERVVSILRKNGHCVGYMGDGVNDAPSLRSSDVGISVEGGTDIAKEASEIILLQQDLEVIYNGVLEGRKVYGNIVKYMKLALSQDFGDVFSIMISSIFLPFLPLLPIQMLIQDFIVEISQIGIPYDNVDEDFVKSPKKWDTKDISKFMKIFGIISSITDIFAFIIFWFIFKYNSVDKQAYFQTAWFIECIISETLIIYYLRSDKLSFRKSNPSIILILCTILTIIATISIPLILSNVSGFNYVILPFNYYLYVIGLAIIYAVIVSIVKRYYLKKYNKWL